MKTKIKTLLALLLSATLFIASLTFTACAPADDDGATPAETVVYSNGGSVVQYGDYVYFINGVTDFADESGKTNANGRVIKGGLYRAKITDSRVKLTDAEKEERNLTADGKVDYNITETAALRDVLDFEYEKKDFVELHEYQIGDPENGEEARVLDENGDLVQNLVPTNNEKSEYRIKVEQLVSKKIGTAGYVGGFWIYDGIIYFATPDNDRNSAGEVQYERAEFYAYNIANDSLSQLYVTKEANTAIPYSFVKRGDSVYLLTKETYFANAEDEEDGIKTGFLLSTEINGTSAGETVEIVSGVDSVYFPENETYDPTAFAKSELSETEYYNNINDYVYFTRTAKDNEKVSGQLLEMISPNGENRNVILNNTVGSISIVGSTEDYLYYKNDLTGGKTALECTDVYAQRNAVYKTVKGEEASLAGEKEYLKTLSFDASDLTVIVPVDTEYGSMPCVVASKADGFYRIEALGDEVVQTKVYDDSTGSSTLLDYNYGRVYGMMATGAGETEEGEEGEAADDSEEETGSSAFFSTSAFEHYSNQTAKIHTFYAPTTTNFGIDFLSVTFDYVTTGNATATTTESYVAFMGDYNNVATSYMNLKKIAGVFNTDAYYPIKLGEVPEYELSAITCYDNECINWHHNHDSWEVWPEEDESGFVSEEDALAGGMQQLG